jgi:hypothetical protein
MYPCIKNIYEKYGKGLWGKYGLKDAFNPTAGWYDPIISIDEGPIVIMIENGRRINLELCNERSGN